MSGSTLSNTITLGITLGSVAYPSPLTITSTGAVQPASYAAAGLVATLSTGYVLNQGTLTGGIGQTGSPAAAGGTGGFGVYLEAGSLTNAGMLVGGDGGTGGIGVAGTASVAPGGYGGAGGAGIAVAGGTLRNNGTVVGGGGGGGGAAAPGIGVAAGGRGGDGGAGVDLLAGSLTNSGVIVGGYGGGGGTADFHIPNGDGGVGVYALGGDLTNFGTIIGGAPPVTGGSNGFGVLFASGGTLTNAGLIEGGTGTSGGVQWAVYFRSGASRLIVDPGAQFRGAALANTSFSNVLELASGSTGAVGTVGGYGYSGFTTIVVDPGATWVATELFSVAAGGSFLVDGSLLNQGSVVGAAGQAGTSASAGGTQVAGGAGGIGISLVDGSLTNDGVVKGGGGGTGGAGNGSLSIVPAGMGGLGGAGVAVAGGSLVNDGTIAGGDGGVGGGNGGVTANYGNGGTGGAGVVLTAGGLTNMGTILGGAGGSAGGHSGAGGDGGAGVCVEAGSVINSGMIVGGAPSDALGPNGGVGVAFASGGTLINAGVIEGGSAGASAIADAVYFGTGTARLIVDPGASFVGAVVAAARYDNVVELTSAATAGTLAGVGGSIVGFGTVAFDPGASWVVSGSFPYPGVTMAGFGAGDTIELPSFVETGYSFASGSLVLSSAGASQTIGFAGSLTAGNFDVTVADGNSFIELRPACFAAGTRIATDHGEVAVEALAVGGRVRVLLGEGWEPIRWIGRRTVDCAHHPAPAQVWPVRVRAGAFGPGRPRRDVFLSPDHAVYVNEVLIPVRYLLTGDSIAQVQVDTVAYYHLELAAHDVILAEGLPAESYLETADRANFINSGAVVHQAPDFTAHAWDAFGCAPLIVIGPQLVAARRLVRDVRTMPAARRRAA